MIQLINIEQLPAVLSITPDNLKEEYTEILPHLNVYGAFVDEQVAAYAYIMDGYIIGGHHGDSQHFNDLVKHLQTRYDELLMYQEVSEEELSTMLLNLGFLKEEEVLDEESNKSYNAFSWLSE